MLLHDSRRDARASADGELIILEDQDRGLWDQAQISEGQTLLERGLRMRRPGPYQIQAAITALHAEAINPGETDWRQIEALYATLAKMNPSPIVDLNRAVAVAMARGIEQGLSLMDHIDELDEYYLYHSARADLLRRSGRKREAAEAYRRALELAENQTEVTYLRRRLREVTQTDESH